jgi:arylsulfatase A-like enzyme
VLRSTWLLGGTALLLLVAGAALLFLRDAPAPATGSVRDLLALHRRGGPPTSLIFVVADTLRADRLSGQGYVRPTSPFLDSLARGGVSFRRVLAPSSWTKPAMASILTASYPATHGVLRADDALPAAARLPAEVFRDAGYHTGAVVANHWVTRRFGFDQGFDTYLRFTREHVRARRRRDAATDTSGYWVDRDIGDAAIEFLRVNGHEPFFLYLHYMGVHNYESDPAPAHFGRDLALRYDNAVAELDRELERLVGALDRLGLRSRTLLVVTSDHGESLAERGYEGHGYSLYAQEVNVPLVISPPFALEPPLVVNTPVSSIDLFPTLYEMLGLPPAPDADGRSLVPVLRTRRGAEPEVAPVFSHLERRWSELGHAPEPIAAVLDRRLYLVQDLADPSRAELFDVVEDPAERENLARGAPAARLAALREELRAYAEGDPAAWGGAEHVELGPDILGELEQLGYLIRE